MHILLQTPVPQSCPLFICPERVSHSTIHNDPRPHKPQTEVWNLDQTYS